MTHDELIAVACRWLTRVRRCAVVLGDVRCICTPEQPDAIGWDAWGWSVLVEAKASRSDFLRDQKKWHRQLRGMGQERWYIAPAGMLSADDAPEGWGILAATPRGVSVVKADSNARWSEEGRCWGSGGVLDVSRMQHEMPLLLHALRLSGEPTSYVRHLRKIAQMRPVPPKSPMQRALDRLAPPDDARDRASRNAMLGPLAVVSLLAGDADAEAPRDDAGADERGRVADNAMDLCS